VHFSRVAGPLGRWTNLGEKSIIKGFKAKARTGSVIYKTFKGFKYEIVCKVDLINYGLGTFLLLAL